MKKRSNLYLAIVSLFFDLLAVFGGLMVAYQLRSDGTVLYYWPISSYTTFITYLLPIWLIFFASQGLYNVRNLPRGWSALGRAMIGLMAGWGAMLIILYLWHSPEAQAFPRLVVVYGIGLTALFCSIGKLLLTTIVDSLYRSGLSITKTVVIGPEPNGFVKELTTNSIHGRKVVATFTADEAVKKLDALSTSSPFSEIIVNDPHLSEEHLLEILNYAEEKGINFVLVPSLLSVRATNVAMGTMAGTPIMQFLQTPLEGWRRVYKRIFDIVISGVSLIILSPLMLILWLLAQLSTGSGLIKQVRVGQDGKEFYFHKFRSMYVDWERRFPDFRDWSSDEKTDPRITPIGRIIRKTNLDELPQLWDVFRGVMSIVGPRPEQPKYVEKFASEIPSYLKRHYIKTGLTGWAQVNGLRGDTSVAERVKYDLYYIENWSLWLDVRIIISTVVLIIRGIFGGREG